MGVGVTGQWVRLPPGTTTGHAGMQVQSVTPLGLCFLPIYSGRQQMMAHALRSLTPTREAWEFWLL